MARFIKCQYHGKKDKGNSPVNVDLVLYFDTFQRDNQIYFYFAGDDKQVWDFENKETMELEYKRLVDLLAE